MNPGDQINTLAATGCVAGIIQVDEYNIKLGVLDGFEHGSR